MANTRELEEDMRRLIDQGFYIISVIRTTEFAQRNPQEGPCASYIILYNM